MTVIYVKRYRYATFGVAGWILLAVEYDGKIYRGMGPFYNAQPDDHVTSENEDVLRINKIVRATLREWSGLATIQDDVITVPLFYDVPGYDRNPKYRSRIGDSFGTLINLKSDATIPRDIPWQQGEEIYLS
jgi:hypothetical protein